MGIGVIAIQTNQHERQPGPPFAANSAENGLSVDAGTGRIVLGNDVGSATDPARLLSNREILMHTAGLPFSINLLSAINNITTILNGIAINVTGGDFTSPNIRVTSGSFGSSNVVVTSGDDGTSAIDSVAGLNGVATLRVASDVEDFIITADSTGFIRFTAAGTEVWRIRLSDLFTQIGPTLVAHNGATLQVTGTMTSRRFMQTQGAGVYNVNRDLDSNKIISNTAAATLNLPDMSGGNLRSGFTLGVNCANVAGITVDAAAGQTIRFGSLATSVGGTISSTDVGAFARLTLLDSTTWITETFLGAWVLT